MPKQSLTVRLPDDLVRIVRNRAENEGLSQAEVVERSLRRDLLGAAEPGLDAEEWQQWRLSVEKRFEIALDALKRAGKVKGKGFG